MGPNLDDFGECWRPTPPVRWLDGLYAYWNDQRAEAAMPDANELFLADFVDIMPHLVLGYRDEWRHAFRIEFAGQAATALLGDETVDRYPEEVGPDDPLAWLGEGYASIRELGTPDISRSANGALVALHLPYAEPDGQVGLILSVLAPCPDRVASRGRPTMVRAANDGVKPA